jgi:hypothetical protein
MPFKVFAVNEILTAADVNDYLAEQSIATFSGTAERGSAIGTPVTGQFTFITGTSSLEYWNGSSWAAFSGGGGGAADALMLMGG